MPGRILVVDDDIDVRESVTEALVCEGYEVTGANNGIEALRLLNEDALRPDVILLDVMMPTMDGWAFRAEQLKHTAIADIPVIVLTAYGLRDRAVDSLHVAGVLCKPFRLEDLWAAVAHALHLT